MAVGIMTIVHAVVALLLIIELGLISYVVSVTNNLWFGDNDTPSQFAFMLFCVIWSIIIMLYLGVVTTIMPKLYHSLVSLVLTGLTMLFWFAGSIAMAAYIGVPDCHGNNFCQTAQAGVAFGFFLWLAFLGMFIMELMGFLRGGANVDSSRKPGQAHVGV